MASETDRGQNPTTRASFISKRDPFKPKVIHMAKQIRGDGAVSAVCFVQPRAIDLRRATWTIRKEAVTCEKCREAINDAPR